jgi:glucose/arabinose dehydrogenase
MQLQSGRQKTLSCLVFILLSLSLLSACARHPRPVSDSARGRLLADPPQPDVSAGLGTTTITWEVADGQAGQVYVSVDGMPEVLVVQGTSGERTINWIAPGRRYVFRLYESTTHQLVLAELVIETAALPDRMQQTPHDIARGRWPGVSERWYLVSGLGVVIALYVVLRRQRRLIWAHRVAVLATITLAAAVAIAVSQVPPRALLTEQPYPDAAEYAEAAWHLARGDGYVTRHGFGTAAGSPVPLPPLHPPGYSLALVPFVLLDYDNFPANSQLGAKVLTLLNLLVLVALAWRVAGPLAAAIATVLVGVSPYLYTSASLVLSDTFSATLLLLAVWFWLGHSRWHAVVSGILAGLLPAVRLNTLIDAAVLILTQPARWRRLMLLFAMPGLLLVGGYQWAVFGNPFTTGQARYLPNLPYIQPANAVLRTNGHDTRAIWGDNLDGWFESWVCGCTESWPLSPLPNLIFYPAVLLGLIWTYAPPLTTVPGIFYAIRHRHEPVVRVILPLVVVNLAFFAVSVVQARRYLAGTASLLVILSAVALARGIAAASTEGLPRFRQPQWSWAGARGTILALAAYGLLSFSLLPLIRRPTHGQLPAPVPTSVAETPPAPTERTLPADFDDRLVVAIERPTDVAFTPDGRMLVTVQSGQLYIVQDMGAGHPSSVTLALDLAEVICSNWERGLNGVAVDPAFVENQYVYLYYTFNKHGVCPLEQLDHPSRPVNRLVRVTLPPSNRITADSAVIMLDNIPQHTGTHNGGDINFAHDGMLYLSVGDGGKHVNGTDLSNLAGKILRLHPDGTVPVDNPYAGVTGARRCGDPTGVPEGSGPCSEIYVHGLRNPYRFAFQPASIKLYINDVGDTAWEEINVGRRAAHYGWNLREGPCPYPARLNCSLGAASGYVDPVYYYHHNTGCFAITGSAFVPAGIWPAEFDHAYLFGDYGCGQIWRLIPGNPYTAELFVSGLGPGSLVSMQFGPTGSGQALYYVTHADGGQVRRILYTGDLTLP